MYRYLVITLLVLSIDHGFLRAFGQDLSEKKASSDNLETVIRTTLENHNIRNGEKLDSSQLKKLMGRINRMLGKGLVDSDGEPVRPTDRRYRSALQYRIIQAYRDLFEDDGEEYVASSSLLASMDEDLEQAEQELKSKRWAENKEKNLRDTKLDAKLVHYMEENHSSLRELLEHWKKCRVCNDFADELGMNPPPIEPFDPVQNLGRRVQFQCRFYGQIYHAYVVDSFNVIWRVYPRGQKEIIGSRVPTPGRQFAWEFVTNLGERWFVTSQGGIYATNGFGGWLQVGDATAGGIQ